MKAALRKKRIICHAGLHNTTASSWHSLGDKDFP